MARQVGMIKLRGKLGDLVFYRVDGQYLIRTAGNMDTERYIQDPAFEAARLHGREYGGVMRCASLLLKAFKQAFPDRVHPDTIRRLASVLNKVKNHDPAPRGQRTVHGGLQQAEGRELMQHFPLDPSHPLPDSLSKHIRLDPSTAAVHIAPIDHSKWSAPENCTHFRIGITWLQLDFQNREWAVWRSGTEGLRLDQNIDALTLEAPQDMSQEGHLFILGSVEYLRKENDHQEPIYFTNMDAAQVIGVIS